MSDDIRQYSQAHAEFTQNELVEYLIEHGHEAGKASGAIFNECVNGCLDYDPTTGKMRGR
jgi:hypothetical protein